MDQLHIYEDKWYRGQGGSNSALHTEQGTMCCLGFECVRRGFSPEELRGRGEPETLFEDLFTYDMGESYPPHQILDPEWYGLLRDDAVENSNAVMDLMVVNDYQVDRGFPVRNYPMRSPQSRTGLAIKGEGGWRVENDEDRKRIITRIFKDELNIEVIFKPTEPTNDASESE